jgi:hypothetical protein
MLEHKTQAVPVRVQRQPDNIAESGVPGYGFVTLFFLSVRDNPSFCR